jgi:cytochrome c-type biogenesis protein
MKNVAADKTPRFSWNIQLPLPRSRKGWVLVLLAAVTLVFLTIGLAQIFQVDLSDDAVNGAAVETPDLHWQEMIEVLTRHGVRPSRLREDVKIDALLATPQYLAAARRQAPGGASDEPSIVFYLNEATHVDDLPDDPPTPTLRVGTMTYEPAEVLMMATSPHHRATIYRYRADGLDLSSGLDLVLPAEEGQAAVENVLRWELPIQYSAEYKSSDILIGVANQTTYAPKVSGVAVLAILGGLLAAMWPCLFQLTAYFIPAMAGMSMHDASNSSDLKPRLGVVKIALFFVLGFTVIYTLAGAVIGYGSQQLSSMESFYTWQRYLSIGAGILLMGMALRVAASARAPLVCKMPILSKASGSGMTSPWESMLVGVAFATGCMTCFGSAILIGMVLYVGLAGSPIVGATLLFLFSLGMGVPLVIGAMAMARVLPLLLRMEKIIPWMGLASAILIAGYGLILVTGNFMTLTSWLYKLMGMTQAL